MVGFERIEGTGGPPKFKCVICGSRSGSRLENLRKHLASRGHKLKLAEMNKMSQNAAYQQLTGIKMEYDDWNTANVNLHDDNNIVFNEDIFTPIQDIVENPDDHEICLSREDLQEFNHGSYLSGSEQESEIDMPLEELFDMISGGSGNDLLGLFEGLPAAWLS